MLIKNAIEVGRLYQVYCRNRSKTCNGMIIKNAVEVDYSKNAMEIGRLYQVYYRNRSKACNGMIPSAYSFCLLNHVMISINFITVTLANYEYDIRFMNF